ncbi:MAG: DUF1351 domain-containing protein [Clostridium sp.]|uniref:DUF1351 domain-containing protein n=1 Tax=Clostridia TaxID=186801 RepID=UPI00067E8CC0|nr:MULTISPECIES: DUF1351 domain-containing protein [Clostridia]MBS6765957.1 DUF1351 domain-containing protein [Clostridium sp.]
MELKIMSPQENGFIKEIQWNNEELKKDIAEKMQEYKTLVFTEDTIKDAKSDRAKLNKLKAAFDDERKRIKKLCMEPYDKFEKQVKELIALIDEPIGLIDSQIKEVEEQKRIQKRRDIEELFKTIGFQKFVTLDKIFDDKWLNASVSLSKIEESMKSTMYRIGNEIATINNLPEFSFEAREVYVKTLDIAKAIKEGQRLAEIQKRKNAYEEEQQKKVVEEEAAKAEEKKNAEIQELQTVQPPVHEEAKIQTDPAEQRESLIQMDFRVWCTKDQLLSLRQYLVNNKIKFGKVE